MSNEHSIKRNEYETFNIPKLPAINRLCVLLDVLIFKIGPINQMTYVYFWKR